MGISDYIILHLMEVSVESGDVHYLAIVLDLFNRKMVSWALKPRMTADFVTDALTMAWFRQGSWSITRIEAASTPANPSRPS